MLFTEGCLLRMVQNTRATYGSVKIKHSEPLMNKLIIAWIVISILSLLGFAYYIYSSSSSSSSSSSTSTNPFSSSDLWMEDRWTSGSGYNPRSATYGSPINTNSMECDYCGCPVQCDGTPKRVDPGCPAQTIQCVTQDCSVSPNCRRGT